MKVAVLIPVYNAAPYLRQCLDSVLAQSGADIGVFCCDDGSGDRSKAILEEYAHGHGNVHVAFQENAGVVATRNRLLDELPAEYGAFAFLDSDDYVAPGMYAKLVEALERTDADIAECEWDGNERVIDDMSVYLLRRTAVGRWINVINKLYRRSSLGTIRFRRGLRFEEDLFFNLEAHAAARRKVLVPGRFYTYRTNPESATNRLDLRAYFSSTTERIRLSLGVFLNAGRVPSGLEADFRRELARDAYRMCIRKNLRKNRDAGLRRELFFAAGEFFRTVERTDGFRPVGLNPIQRAVYDCCKRGQYVCARLLASLS